MNQKEQLTDTAQKIVRLLRAGDSSEASSQLNLFLASVQQVLLSGSTASRPVLAALQTTLESMQRHDWVALADALEFTLIPLLPCTDQAQEGTT